MALWHAPGTGGGAIMGEWKAGSRKVILITTGTKGDLNPFLALGKGLAQRGFRSVVATNIDHEPEVRRLGLEFAAISPSDHPQSHRDEERFREQVKLPSRQMVQDYLASEAAAGETPLLLCRTENYASVAAARSFGFPFAIVNLQPQLVVNPWEPRAFQEAWRVRVYNDCLARAGQRLVENVRETYAGAAFILSLFPRWYGLPQAALWTAGEAVGFPFLKDAAIDDDAGLISFLRCRGRPVVFAPGTGFDDVAALYQDACAICDRLAASGVFMTPFLPEDDGLSAGRGTIMVRHYVGFTSFLGNARCIVHHGGIGTTAQAIRSGIPQVVRPRNFDQPDNAARVLALGLGAVEGVDAGSAQVAETIERLCGDAATLARIAAAAAAVKAEDAVARACEHVARFVRGGG